MPPELESKDLSEQVNRLSPDELDALVSELSDQPAEGGAFTISRRERKAGHQPLSFAQERMLFLDRLKEGDASLNISGSIRLKGHCDVQLLERSLSEIVRRHEILRTHFEDIDGEPAQVIGEPFQPPLPVRDLRTLSPSEREQRVEELATNEARQPFDVGRGPLLRFLLLRLQDSELLLVTTLHHIVADGWSVGIMLRELAANYEAASAHRAAPLGELPIQYADFACWQREEAGRGGFNDHLGFWRERLGEGVPVLDLAGGGARAHSEIGNGRLSLCLPSRLTTDLGGFSRKNGVTLFVTLLAAFKTLLYRLSGETDLALGSPVAGRGFTEIEGLIGCFLNNVVLRTDVSGNPTFLDVVNRVRKTASEAQAHQDVPFEMVLNELGPRRRPDRNPYFQVFFNMVPFRLETIHASGLELSVESAPEIASKFDLTLYAAEGPSGLELELVYDADLFSQGRVREILAQFQGILEETVANPERQIDELALATESSSAVLPDPAMALESWWTGSVYEQFSKEAGKAPRRTAVVEHGGAWTYGELDDACARLAGELIRCGVRPQEVVAIYADRSAALVAALLGIMKAGAAFLILDSSFPSGRLAACLRRAKPAAFVALKSAGTVPDSLDELTEELCPGRCLRWSPADASATRAEMPAVEVGPDSLAYLAFTSGSTGEPKGILGNHGPISHYLRWARQTFSLEASDRFAMLSGLSHDPLLRDVFTPLSIGGVLCIPDAERIGVPGYLTGWLAEQAISVCHMTPAHCRALAASDPGHGRRLEHLRYVFFGGDVLTREEVKTVTDMADAATCVNFYGTTETPQAAAFYEVPVGRCEARVPLGRGIDGAQLLVLSRDGRLAGIGERGEVFVRTSQLARGYLTLEEGPPRFGTNPFTGIPGDRIYKTGDLGRYREDGAVEFLRRGDDQVKIRGYRIEPAEIESALCRHPQVGQAAVVCRGSAADAELVACWVPAAGNKPRNRELRGFLRQALPDYMVPSAFLAVETIPLTPNGKVDRAALEASAEGAERCSETDWTAPRNPTEEILLGLWCETLGVDRAGIHDDFFALGGHSLLAMRLLARVRQAVHVELSLAALYDAPTVATLAARLAGTEEGPSTVSGDTALEPVQPAPLDRHEPFPLTDIQHAYWVGRSSGIALGNVASHRYLELESSELDLDRFNLAWRRLIARHDMLRAVIQPDGRQRILEEVPPHRIGILDLRRLAPEERAEQLELIRATLSHRILPTDRWPLFEIFASLLDDRRVRIHFSFDYLLADAWSFFLLIRDFSRFYEDSTKELPSIELSFRDYVLAEVALKKGELYRRSLDYWRGRLRSLPPGPELPQLASVAAVSRPRFVRARGRLASGFWRSLKGRASRMGVPVSSLLLAAYAEVLTYWSKSPRFSLVLTLFHRLPIHPQVSQVVGDFTSTVLFAVDNSRQEDFQSRARRLSARLWEDLDHRYVSGVEVMRERARQIGSFNAAAAPVVFTSMLNLAEAHGEDPLADLPGEVVFGISQTPQVALDHQVFERDGTLEFNWDSVDGVFPEGMVADMRDAYRGLLERLAESDAAWQEPVRPLLPDSQRQARAIVNSTDSEIPQGHLHASLATQEKLRSDEPAVISAKRTLTYAELGRRATDLGIRLRRAGAAPNTLVGVVMQKGWEQVVAVEAILRAGGAYLPIDPSLPVERMHYLLEHGRAELVLTQSWLDSELSWPEGVRRFVVDTEEVSSGGTSSIDPVQSTSDLAYVIFTSGSTGLPKGVMIDHRGALNTVVDMNRRFRVGHDDRVLSLSALNFDLSVYDVFGLTAAGGAIVMPEPQGLRDPAHWLDCIERGRVTIWNTVPAMMEMLVEYLEGRGERLPESLRLVLMSGDWIPVTLPDRIHALSSGGTEVVSLGGATEASIWSILYPIDEIPASWTSVPYGKPMVNQGFHVLTSSLEPAPVWVPGELYIAGIGLAQGYWRDQEKSKASFFVHPRTGERLYRTGDLGRYHPDGNIEFLGREDFQVKIQGYRVELGEIEAALLQHASVRAAVATAVGDPRGNRRLAAYVVPESGALVDTEELRRFLDGKLPGYMVPSAIVEIEALPLTGNGKIDRRALPDPEEIRPDREEGYVAPRSPVEEILGEMTAKILEIDKVGIHDDLFELGGNSVTAILLMSRIRETFQVEIPLQKLFESPTVAGLAAVLLECQAASAETDEMDRMLAELEELSEEEVEDLLASEIEEWSVS